ncbi:TPA: hypothetical protein ACLQU7_005700 [Bacillus tropicus]|uniref:hypothetical protein n=1 Tax=Bacillus cereus group TaxID=86661 RepID=UPI00003CB59B|nr:MULTISPECIES: hypothetical protein [Bacillus cereus group]AIY72994.1 hypothetical protein NT98_5839 [Bacillus cereus]AJI07924.1 hypothetical protein AQ16_5545 [Bacillus cereus G9241]EAL15926.1 conserved hypothetical protein protein [Bacillus cereus G9241]QPS53559.1 hypothetical protein I6G54_28675 [Bacillus tropicus]
MYLLELIQGDDRQQVGLFSREEDVKAWIESIPYVHKNVEDFEGEEFITYTMSYLDLPLYEEIKWKSSIYPLTKYMFTLEDTEIMIDWFEVPIMDKTNQIVEGSTRVDAYNVPNKDVKKYIEKREEIRRATKAHYEPNGHKIETEGLGSEDGEYLLVENGPFIILDAETVYKWENKTSIEQFFKERELELEYSGNL